MKVVCLGRREERQMVARVRVQGRQYGQREPQPGRGHVRAQQEHPEERWQQVAADVLQGMTVDGGDGHGRRPLVVLLVYVPVEVAIVEQPVRVVEADLLAEYVEGDLGEEAVKGRQLVERRKAAPLHEPVGAVGQGQADGQLVEQDLADDLEELGPRDRLVRAGLGLVAAQGRRPVRHVHERVDAAEEPVDQEGQGYRACGCVAWLEETLGMVEVSQRTVWVGYVRLLLV